MPVRICTGFEQGYDNAGGSWEKGNAGNRFCDTRLGAPNHTTSTPRSGSRCLEINQSAAVEHISWTADTLTASQTFCVFNFWFRFPTLPSADVVIVNVWSLGGDINFVFRNSDDVVLLNNETTGTNSVGPIVVADTWYHVEISIDYTAAGTADWTIDGTAQTQLTDTPASTTLVACLLGAEDAQTMHCLYDDVVIWTDTSAIGGYPFGKQSVKLLIADTGGTTAEIGTANATGRMVTNSAIDATHNSANILTAISEVPPLIGATATGVGQRTSGAGNAVGIPMTSYTLVGSEAISGIRILVVGWAGSTTANNIGMRTFNGTTETILFAAADPNFDNNTTASAWLCKMVTPANFDTQSELDALVVRLGYSTDIAPLPGAHAIYAEVAIKESTAAPAVKNPSFVSQYGSYL
ncbi:MAG: hypothetical protein ACREOB_08505 [Thermodesulfobacteriota bacterium]